MPSRLRWATLAAAAFAAAASAACALSAWGSERLSRKEALSLAFPGCSVKRRAHYLTAQPLQRASELAGTKVESGLSTAHVATRDSAA